VKRGDKVRQAAGQKEAAAKVARMRKRAKHLRQLSKGAVASPAKQGGFFKMVIASAALALASKAMMVMADEKFSMAQFERLFPYIFI